MFLGKKGMLDLKPFITVCLKGVKRKKSSVVMPHSPVVIQRRWGRDVVENLIAETSNGLLTTGVPAHSKKSPAIQEGHPHHTSLSIHRLIRFSETDLPDCRIPPPSVRHYHLSSSSIGWRRKESGDSFGKTLRQNRSIVHYMMKWERIAMYPW